MNEEENEEIIKVLLATDIHLGYLENDPIRGEDTFVTLEEILQIAVKEKVDFILLGGDLFHETKSSQYCIYKCTELFRKYTLGDKPVEIEFLSDQSVNFKHSPNATVNYEDSNINVSLPIFSIHGNHDDPTGMKQISSMDIMAASGLVNYFGRQNSVTDIEIEPILLRKGNTKLAMYGLSYVEDERLVRLLINGKVKMKGPQDLDEWFNLLVWHQNRVANRGIKNFIPETSIPDFFDLVVWGHEHKCEIDPTTTANGVHISQPGSSVATSLSEGESVPKCVGVLEIKGKSFRIEPIRLTTARPFVYKTLTLNEIGGLDKIACAEKSMAEVSEKINEMIQIAKEMGQREDFLPLIRLVVSYRNEMQVFNAIRFGQKYRDKVANYRDIVSFKSSVNVKSNVRKSRKKGKGGDESDEEVIETLGQTVEQLINGYFNEKKRLSVLSLVGLNKAVKKFLDANDNDAIKDLTAHQQNQVYQELLRLDPNIDNVEETILQIRDAREAKEKERDITTTVNNVNRSADATVGNPIEILLSDDEDNSRVTATRSSARKPTGRNKRAKK